MSQTDFTRKRKTTIIAKETDIQRDRLIDFKHLFRRSDSPVILTVRITHETKIFHAYTSFILLQSDKCRLIFIIVAAGSACSLFNGVESRQEIVAVSPAAPSPVHPEIVFSVITVEHKGMSAFTAAAGINDRTPFIQFAFHYPHPLGKGIITAHYVTSVLVISHVSL